MGKVKEDPGYEVLGAVPRWVRCKVTDADRRGMDDALHALIESELATKRAQLRIKNAAKKVADRLKALEEEQLALHQRRALLEEVRPVSCEIRRTETELYLVRSDTGAEYSRRPLNEQELKALHPVLPGTGPAPAVHAAEMVLDEETQRRVTADEEHAAKVKDLLQGFDIQAALDGRDEEPANDDGDEEEEKPKAKAKGKGDKGKKKPGETAEMFPGGSK